jgi:hypothetical protein
VIRGREDRNRREILAPLDRVLDQGILPTTSPPRTHPTTSLPSHCSTLRLNDNREASRFLINYFLAVSASLSFPFAYYRRNSSEEKADWSIYSLFTLFFFLTLSETEVESLFPELDRKKRKKNTAVERGNKWLFNSLVTWKHSSLRKMSSL